MLPSEPPKVTTAMNIVWVFHIIPLGHSFLIYVCISFLLLDNTTNLMAFKPPIFIPQFLLVRSPGTV